MEKLKDEQVIKLFESKGYKIVGEIKNTNKAVVCEKNGYWYRISYSNLKIDKSPSLWGFHNIENLAHNIKNNLSKRNIKSEFISYKVIKKGKRRRILCAFKCECGNEFNRVLDDAIYATYVCCADCVKVKRGKTSRTTQKTIAAIESAGYKIIGDATELRNNDCIEVEDKDGYRGFISANKIASGNGMSRFDIRINKKNYIYNVNKWAKDNSVEAECLGFSDKKYTTQSLLFRCSCGNEFSTSISSFQNGKIRCDICTKHISRYEFTFKQYLDSEGIKYIHQYSLNQCRDVLPLPFDFYLPDYDLIVEVDGEGHFFPCYFNQMSFENAKKSFDRTKKHDEIKNNYCKENNKKLLRIPYTKFNDDTYKEFFQNFVRELATSN